MRLPEVFERYRAEIDTELRTVLADRQLPMYDMLRYHLGWIDEHGYPAFGNAGKALRSTLCLLACETVGGNPRVALPAAAAAELVHNYSLIHDDIQDDDAERRHRPTVWHLWGKPQAINAGNAMHLLASFALFRLSERGIPVPKQLRVWRRFDESTLAMVEGQYLDISYESRLDISVADYLEMIDRKTAALIACSMESGALLGTDDDSVVAAFKKLGEYLGLAFQIRDDVLGVWGDEARTGKPLGGDIRRRKKSLPIVYALEKARGEAKTELVNYYRGKVSDSNGVGTVLKILEIVEAGEQAQAMAQDYLKKALAVIEGLPLLPASRHSLQEIAHFLVERDF